MSHKATHWLEELPAVQCKSGAFRVLFHLCCAHNSKVSPRHACFPSQETLMGETGLSNGGLNNALNALEEAQLIHRIRTKKENGTKGPTYYILRFDFDYIQKPTPDSGVGANSSFEGKPTPVFKVNQLQPTGDKPVKEPVKEPLLLKNNNNDLYSDFLNAHPRSRHCRPEFDQALADGVCPKLLVASASVYANAAVLFDKDKIAFADNFLKRKIFLKYIPDTKISRKTVKPFSPNPITVRQIKSGDNSGAKYLNPAIAKQYVDCGALTVVELQKVGVSV